MERDEPLGALGHWLTQADAGAGRMVLIAGEAGIGKTSLVRAFCEGQRDRARVWWGACDALSTPRPLGPLYDIARAAPGPCRDVMAGEASRHERFAGFLDAMAWPLQPTVVVIEDVHWADEATRDLLVFLARRIHEVNALLIVTYRDDEVGTEHPLRRVLGSIAPLASVERWVVSALSRSAVERLATGHDADLDELLRVTGGNPFFVTEVLASDDGVVPSTVSDAVLARLHGVSRTARSVAEAASVVPDHAEVDLVLAVARADDAAVEECLEAGLLVGSSRSLRFRHELARLAVEASISVPRRDALHAAALAWLSAQEDTDPARLAYHASAAEDGDAVLRYAPLAAERAAAMGANHEAYTHLSQALRHAGRLPAEARLDLLERFATTCAAIGRLEEALRATDGGLDLLEELHDPSWTARFSLRRAGILWNLARNDEAHALVDELVRTLDSEVPVGDLRVRVLGFAAHLRMLARDIQAAMDLANRALALADRLGGRVDRSNALGALGAAQWFVAPDEAESTLVAALELAEAAHDEARCANVLGNLGSGAGEVRRYASADRWLKDAVRWCEARDLDVGATYAHAWSARSAFEQGRWGEADAALDHLMRRSIEDRPTWIVALTVQGRLRARRGDDGAWSSLREASELAHRTGDLQRTWPVVAGLAELSWLVDGTVNDLPVLRDTYEVAMRLQQSWAIGELGFWLWQAGELDGPAEGAAEPFALEMAGDWWGAAVTWERIGCPYEAAMALGDGDEPEELRRALTILGELGAAPLADRVAAKLRRLGVRDLPRRPTRETVDNPGGLTARQLEVLELLVRERTNVQIASELHISPKTVGHHVSAILEKMGVHDRHEAARAARERGMATP